MTPVLHIPIDFERREDVRRFCRAIGDNDKALAYLFRLWTDWATAGCEFRELPEPLPIKSAETFGVNTDWPQIELAHIIEDFCGWSGPEGELVTKALRSGVIKAERRQRNGGECWGLVLNDFWTFNAHFSKQYKTMQQKGGIAKGARHAANEAKSAANHQVTLIEGRGKQFALPLDAAVTSEEIKKCVGLIMLMDRACDKPMRKSSEYSQNEPLMNTALYVVRNYQQHDIEKVYEYVIANRDNPRLGKIPERILEQFGKHLEASRDEQPVAA